MTIEEIREARRREPFEPFSLHLSDGQELRVTHPENLAIFHDRPRVVAVLAEGHAGIKILDIRHVTALTIEPENGQSNGLG